MASIQLQQQHCHLTFVLMFMLALASTHQLIAPVLACAPIPQYNTTTSIPSESTTTTFALSASSSTPLPSNPEPEHPEARKKREKLPFGLDAPMKSINNSNGIGTGSDEEMVESAGNESVPQRQPLHRRVLYSEGLPSHPERENNSSASAKDEQLPFQHLRGRRHSANVARQNGNKSKESGEQFKMNGPRKLCKPGHHHHNHRHHRCHCHHHNKTSTTMTTPRQKTSPTTPSTNRSTNSPRGSSTPSIATTVSSSSSASTSGASRSSSSTSSSSTVPSSQGTAAPSSSQSTSSSPSSASSSSSAPERGKRHAPFPSNRKTNGNLNATVVPVLIVLKTTLPFLQGNDSNGFNVLSFLPLGFTSQMGIKTLLVDNGNGMLNAEIRLEQAERHCPQLVAVVKHVVNASEEIQGAEVQCGSKPAVQLNKQ